MTPTWYTATCVGEYVECNAELPRLVQLVRLLDREDGKDVCIHDQCGHLVAVVYADGRAELLPRGGPLDPVQPATWCCVGCGSAVAHGMAFCNLCREAHIRTGRSKIEADVREGTLRDAILYAVGANADHGQRRTAADKRKAVSMLLADEEWVSKTGRWIADAARVSHTLVDNMRKERPATIGSVANASGGRECQDGRTYPTERRRPAREQGPVYGVERVPADPDDEPDPDSTEALSREPGDDTEQMAKDAAAEKELPKNGAPVFDWRKFEGPLGEVNRGPDMVARAYAVEGNSAEFHQCREALGVGHSIRRD